MAKLFVALMTLLLHAIRAMARSRAEIVIENLALKQQVMVLKDKHPRPTLTDGDRAFWVALRAVWSRWTRLLVIVEPDTVVRWHRTRFRCHWTKLSQRHRRPGRPRIDADIRQLIRRRVVHFNATFHPTAAWVVQQLREAFPYDTAPGYLLFDNDSIFSRAVVEFVKSMGTKPTRTAYFSPWQNPVAERR